jgi:hypothetical protein
MVWQLIQLGVIQEGPRWEETRRIPHLTQRGVDCLQDLISAHVIEPGPQWDALLARYPTLKPARE